MLLFDFDGTLAPIVADPDDARPGDGAGETLTELARRYALVAVVSGRPVEFLTRYLPEEIALSGLYGLESRVGGRRFDHVEAERWRHVIADASSRLASDGPLGMRLEDKGLSITAHFRQHPEVADEVIAVAVNVAATTGLVLGHAKMSVELHPRIEADKGTAVRALVDGVDQVAAVLYAGDDRGDLPAYDALDDLAEADGMTTVRVAVGGPELPTELAKRANWITPNLPGLSALFEALRRA